MGGATLPPGFRFHPTDEELVGYYLKRKVEGLKIELEVIPVIDLYKFDPWELPAKSFLPKRDMEWFFFCPRDRKYPNGSRTNRATKAGYWKATGKDRKVVCQSAVTGYRKTLVFHCGRAPLGDRTDWVMHEYRLWDNLSQGSPNFQGAYALCRVIKRNEHGQRTSDPNGESKGKRVGSSSSNGDFTSTVISSEPISNSNSPSQASYLCNESRHSSPIMPCNELTPAADFEPAAPLATDIQSSYWVSPDLILDSSKDYLHVNEATSEFLPQYEMPNSMTPWQPFEHTEFSSSSSYSDFAGDIEPTDDLSRIVYMSPYSGQGNYMGFNRNEDLTYEGLEPQVQALICRQASGDWVFGEHGGLWLSEDNLMIVMSSKRTVQEHAF